MSDCAASCLILIIPITFIGAVLICLLRLSDAGARRLALLTAATGLALGTIGTISYATSGGPAIQTLTDVPWIKSLGIHFLLAVDGISLTMVMLTGIAATTGVLFSWNVKTRVKEFFALYFALIGGVYGVFMSFDLFLLFVFYELAIIPKYFLIAIWGSGEKRYAAMKLALYSFVGSALVLIGMIGTYVVSGGETMNLIELSQFPFPESFQYWAFPMVFIGFAVLAGMWPFHTWAPTGHAAAPTAASMLLAGVVMKLGAYGALRVAVTLFPAGLAEWREVIGLLAVIGIIYGAGVALVQRDFKFVIGYSSVSHMGFVILGLVTLNEIGMSGAVLQMFSHGIIAGLLFGVVGRMVYDRAHTRQLTMLECMGLAKALPFAMVTFVIAGFASMGMPGFSGFVAEVQILIGAWHASPKFALFAGVGIVIGVAYTLRVMNQVFFGDAKPGRQLTVPPTKPITIPEIVGSVMLIGCTLTVGLYPRILLDLIVPSLHSPMFNALWKEAAL